jgi:pimeloyl-ACP methyl ester carboxylesterase
LQQHLDDLNAVIAACDAAPVVVGHDLGALLGLSQRTEPVRAVVALAPLLLASQRDGVIPGVSDLRARLLMRVRGRLAPPGGRARQVFFGPVAPQPLVDESASLGHQLADPSFPFPLGVAAPTLMLAGDEDGVTSLASLSSLAQQIGADLHKSSGHHALPWEDGWQGRVTEIHRWLIHTLGDPLLALLDEEEER